MMSKLNFNLGMAQMLVKGGQPEQNLNRAAKMIWQAADQGCAVVVLPECLDLGWTDPAARELAQPLPGPHSDVLAQVAEEAGVYVVAGLTERAGGQIYNAAVLISPQGEILLKHRKINIMEIAQDLYATGDSLAVVQTPLGTIGINICADNFPNSLVFGHSLARMGAQLLLSPCAWAMPPEHDNSQEPYGELWKTAYSTLTQLYDLIVVGVSNVGWLRGGPWQGYKCIGCSLAIGPGGVILAEAPYGETAESLTVIEVEPVERTITGAAIAGMLAGKGYEGP
jgi:predicted amidohydrolase